MKSKESIGRYAFLSSVDTPGAGVAAPRVIWFEGAYDASQVEARTAWSRPDRFRRVRQSYSLTKPRAAPLTVFFATVGMLISCRSQGRMITNDLGVFRHGPFRRLAMRRPSPLPTLDRRTVSPRRSLVVTLVVEVGAIAAALALFVANFMDARSEAMQVQALERHGVASQPRAR